MRLKEFLFSFKRAKDNELKMVWEVSKEGKINFLIGTAHFSIYPYRKFLYHYIEKSAKVIFEGPLDEESRKKIVALGSQENDLTILQNLDKQTILKLKNLISDLFLPQNPLPFVSSWPLTKEQFLSDFFQNRRPWLAFFQIWAHFLKRHGWHYSVDLEAFQIASKLGKEIIFLENIQEQIASLESIPLERIVSFLKKIDYWPELIKKYARLYAEGNIEALLATTKDFPTRCLSIVENRDQVMFNRLRHIFAKGEGVAFLGAVHLPGINGRFKQEGYAIRQILEIK